MVVFTVLLKNNKVFFTMVMNTKISLFILSLIVESVGAFNIFPTHSSSRSAFKMELGAGYSRDETDAELFNILRAPASATRKNRRTALGKIFVCGLVASSSMSVHPAQANEDTKSPPSKTKKTLGEEYRQGTAALADSEEAEVLPREAYTKLSSGVVYADIGVGNGEMVKVGSRVNLQWVLRRSNGYFVDSSAVSDSVPFIFTVGDPGGAIGGLDAGIRGMRAGGTRRVLIPPRLAYVNGVEDGKPGPIPVGFGPRQQMRRVMQVRKDVPGEYIFLEVKVTKVR